MSRCARSSVGLGLLLLVVPFCWVPTSLALSEMRVWKSKAGTYEVHAELISSDRESVKLKTEDGRVLTVALAKLSQADLDYLSTQSEAAARTNADVIQIKQKVVQFYEALRGSDEELQELLAAEAKTNLDRSSSLFQSIQQPDRGHRPRVSKVTVNEEDQTAVADFRLRVKGKNSRMQMLFVSSEGQWGVAGIIGPGEEDGTTETISFVDTSDTGATPGSRNETAPVSASPAGSKGPQRSPIPTRQPLTTPDIQTRGAAAYAAGSCAKCHDDKGTGTIRGPDLTDDEWLHCDGSAEGIRQVLESGVSKQELSDKSLPFAMNPATKLVPASDLEVLAEYVKALGSGSD